MNDKQKTEISGGNEDEHEIGLLDLVIVIARRKRQILMFTFCVTVVVAGLSLLLPNSYKASTKILPPQQAQSGAAALLAQLGGVAGAAAGAAGIKNPNDLYIGMLKSRTIADKLIGRFGLMKAYDADTMEATRKMLEEHTLIGAGKDGLIFIEVEDKEQKRVADIANAYADELLRLTKVLAITEASQRRIFFERQLEASKENLSKAEFAMKTALDTHGVISVDSDSRAVVETVGRLRAQIAVKEIQLNAMKAFVTANNQDYKRIQEEISSARGELGRLQNGRPDLVDEGTGKGKPIGLENIKILREVKYHQMLYELLSKQYEVARLDESKDASIIQVLDRALEPERKFKPRRSIITLVAALLSVLAAICWVLATDAGVRGMQSEAQALRWLRLREALRWRT